MPSYRYLIVGGGMTADAAVRGIREVDPNASIGLIGAEIDPPYDRPPLSKGLWKGKPLAGIWRGTEAQGVDLHLGRTAEILEPHDKRVTDGQGVTYTFEKLLLATGGTPRRLRIDDDPTVYFRTVDDYRRLHTTPPVGRDIAVFAMTGAACAAQADKAPPGGDYQKVSDLVALPEFIPGLGTLYVQPATLPAGPFLAYDRNDQLVSTIYMIPLEDIEAQKQFDDLAVGGESVQSVDLYYNAGHPGVEAPHYHVVLWHVAEDDAELE